MEADSSHEQSTKLQHLRKVPVCFVDSLKRFLNELFDGLPLSVRDEVDVLVCFLCELLYLCSAKEEDDARQEVQPLHFLQVLEELFILL